MNIVFSEARKKRQLYTFAVGSVIQHEERIYMIIESRKKIDYDFQKFAPVVRLQTGELLFLEQKAEVLPYDAELHLT